MQCQKTNKYVELLKLKTMTNEEMAREIAAKLGGFQEAYYGAMEMAQWKDEQHKQEKQQWIDEAAEWFSYRFPNMSKEALEMFKEDVKGV